MSHDNQTFDSSYDDLEYDAKSIQSIDSEITVDSEAAKRELDEYLATQEKSQVILDRIRELNAQALTGRSGTDPIQFITINLNSLIGETSGTSKILGTIIEDSENAPSKQTEGQSTKIEEIAPSTQPVELPVKEELQPNNKVISIQKKSLVPTILIVISSLIILSAIATTSYFRKPIDTLIEPDRPKLPPCYNFNVGEKNHNDGTLFSSSAWLSRKDNEELMSTEPLAPIEKVIVKVTEFEQADPFCVIGNLSENFIFFKNAIYEVRGFKYRSGMILDDFETDFSGVDTLFVHIITPRMKAEDLHKKLNLVKEKLFDDQETRKSFIENVTIYDFNAIAQIAPNEMWDNAFEKFKSEMQGIAIFPTLPSIVHMVNQKFFAPQYQVHTRSSIQLVSMELFNCATRSECEAEIRRIQNFYHFIFYENLIYQTKPLDCGISNNNETKVEDCDSYRFLVTETYSEKIKSNFLKVVKMLIAFGKLKLSKYDFDVIVKNNSKIFGNDFYVEDLEDQLEDS